MIRPNSTAIPDSAAPQGAPDETAYNYAVRVGVHGQVGRFAAAGESYRRGDRVICRTNRGLEVGAVLSTLRTTIEPGKEPDGRIVRRMTAEDHMLWSHLQNLATQCQSECQAWLNQSQTSDQLIDVEPLLDGRTLYFHFLQSASTATEIEVERLVAIFQKTVEESDFARLLEHGCGPGCGTDKATGGCGSSCSSCIKSCSSRRSR